MNLTLKVVNCTQSTTPSSLRILIKWNRESITHCIKSNCGDFESRVCCGNIAIPPKSIALVLFSCLLNYSKSHLRSWRTEGYIKKETEWAWAWLSQSQIKQDGGFFQVVLKKIGTGNPLIKEEKGDATTRRKQHRKYCYLRMICWKNTGRCAWKRSYSKGSTKWQHT